MNVMHVILTLEQGGAQEVVRLLCEHAPAGWRVPVVAAFEDGPVRGQLERLGVRVAVLGPRLHGIEALPRFLAEGAAIRRRLQALVDEHEVDLVQTHLLELLDFHALSLLGRGRPRAVVWTLHNVEFLPDGSRFWPWLKQLGHRALYRLFCGRASAIVAVSPEVRRAFARRVGCDEARVTVVENGVDLARFEAPGGRASLRAALGLPPDAAVALVVGRLAEQKGQRSLIEAARRLDRAALHLLFVGEGPLEGELRAAARAAGLAERVHFLGVRGDVPALLAACELFVLPSLWEGLSVALLEAMAAARPIVATDVSGTRAALGADERGLVVPPGDPAALATAIARLLDDAALARELGRRAREHVAARYSVAAQVAAMTEVYTTALGAAEPSACEAPSA